MEDDQFRILLEYLQYSWSGFNIIFLRNNVLTYYRKEAQEKALTGILNSLSPGGILIIGCHERLPHQPQSLRPTAELSYVFNKVS